MKLANIIYEKDLVNHVKVEYINYFNKKIEYDLFDEYSILPTLYVGWSFMKQSNINNIIFQNADILKKFIIANKLYWEFSFEESKSSHVKGIETFIKLVPHIYFSSKYTYIDLDPVFFQIKNIQYIMNIVPNNIDCLYNYKNEMIYILSEQKIFGINLKMFGFFKFNLSNILTTLESKTKNIQNDLDGNIYQSYYKILPNFTHLKRYIIVILSK